VATETSEVELVHDNQSILRQVCIFWATGGFFSVECDYWEYWYHYECLPTSVQTYVDLNLVAFIERRLSLLILFIIFWAFLLEPSGIVGIVTWKNKLTDDHCVCQLLLIS
jgi:hypothetical protein